MSEKKCRYYKEGELTESIYMENYNPNPKKNAVGDCVVRAISKAMNQSWETTYAGLVAQGFMMADMPNANHVWGRYLKNNGFKRYFVDDHGENIYTVEDFCRDNPEGIYVLAISGHVVCVIDGKFYDSWDSSACVPIYYWTRCKDGDCRKKG